MAMKGFKFRLFTTANQDRELAIMLETHRRLYNQALDGRMLCWDAAGVDWSYYEQSRWLTIQRRLNPYLARLNNKSASITLRRLDKTYRAFFKRKRGFPRFKGRDRFNSFAFAYKDGAKIVNKKLRLHHAGTIRVRWHRELPDNCKIKLTTILRECGKWFVLFAVEIPNAEPTTNPARVGIDIGLTSFVTTSDGESLGESQILDRQLPELRRRQRALARCKRGSNRRKLVKKRVTKLHAKVRNTRRDMHHKVARSLVNRYGSIAAESLNVANMLRNGRFARRIGDASWGSFIVILCSKAEYAGCTVTLVDAKYTSQQCSNCGETVQKSLRVRVHKCACGCVLDRDHNAAINILGQAGPESHNEVVALHGSKSPCFAGK